MPLTIVTNAQIEGLVGLWDKTCAGGILPARCTKDWYFSTFCGESAAALKKGELAQPRDSFRSSKRARGGSLRKERGKERGTERGKGVCVGALGCELTSYGIVPYLNGTIKPYDVCAFLTAIPSLQWWAPAPSSGGSSGDDEDGDEGGDGDGEEGQGRGNSISRGEAKMMCAGGERVVVNGCVHRLFLSPEHGPPARQIERLLAQVYQRVVNDNNSSGVCPPRRRISARAAAGGGAGGGGGQSPLIDRFRSILNTGLLT